MGASKIHRPPPLRDVTRNPNLPKGAPKTKRAHSPISSSDVIDSKRKLILNANQEGEESVSQKKPKVPSGHHLLKPLLLHITKAQREIGEASGHAAAGAGDDLLLYLEMLELAIGRLKECTGNEIAESSYVNTRYSQPTDLDLIGFSTSACEKIVVAFQAIDSERFELMEKLKPKLEAVQDLFDTTPPIRLEALSVAHHQYSALHMHTFALDGRDGYAKAAQRCTRDLIYRLDDSQSEDDLKTKLFKALGKLFPNGSLGNWAINDPATKNNKTLIDLVYRRPLDRYPLIMVAVRENKKEADDAFSQNCTCYKLGFSSKDMWEVRRVTGAPVFFIQLAGASAVLISK